MTCADCGYMMTAFDKQCPRCKELLAKGLRPQPSSASPEPPLSADSRLRPGLANAHLPVQSGRQVPRPFAPQETTPPRPLRVVSGETTPFVDEPAPLIIYTNRILNWKPYAAAALALLLLVGLYGYWKHSQDVLTQAMVSAARDGACERMPGFDTDREQRACQQLTTALTYTVSHDTDNSATVIFYLNGATSSLAVQINKDDQGDWHALSAKEGDEGNRQSYDRSEAGSHESSPPASDIDSPPASDMGSPAMPADAAPAPNSVSSGSPPYPAVGGGAATAPSSPGYSITTQAGGGAKPDVSQFQGATR